MKLRFPCATFLALQLAHSASAFTTFPATTAPQQSLHVQRGVGNWDNDDFLEGLSNKQPQEGGDEEVGDSGDAAWNERLKKQIEERDEDDSGGSSRFKALMEAAQSGQISGARAIQNPFLQQPGQAIPPPAIPQNPENMSVEEQARMFREMMQRGQSGISQDPVPYQAPLPTTQDSRGGRPVGRNRDADAIANTSDLYFAQLKRDSTVRTIARHQGDTETANKVFEDEGIGQLQELLHKNPYLANGRETEKKFIETVPEEALAPYFISANEDQDSSYTGVSYKEKLRQRRGNKGGAPPQAAAPAPVPAAQAPAPPAPAVQEPARESSPPIQASAQEAARVITPPGVPETPVLSRTSTPEQVRTSIRTLMGLLMKHRGGPNFGSGRLKDSEIDKFESMYKNVMEYLKEEALESAPPASVSSGPSLVSPAATPSQNFPPPASSSPPPTQMSGMIACIEGAITMYRNSPPEIQGSVLTPLRAALDSAVKTCDSILGQAATPVPASSGGNVEGMLACIEGAISMYKNSPPEIQGTVLVPLRAALASAIGTCDSLVGAPSTPPSPPAAVSPPPPEVSAAPPASSVPESDTNRQELSDIYKAVSAAKGDGRLGIRDAMTPDEAENLKNKLMDMRKILMTELENGIPAANGPPESGPQDNASSASKYQQMLAKARAKKESS